MTEQPWVLNDNGAWCWFQGERAVVDARAGLLLVGSVAAPEGAGGEARAGNIEVTALDLAGGRTERHVLHEQLEADDHDAPALLIRPDGRYLAMYTKHGADSLSRWRVSVRPHDPSAWTPERTFDWEDVATGTRATYSNLCYQPRERRLYNFVRAVDTDPSIMVSDDLGDTWRYAGQLFSRERVGYCNAYARYAVSDRRIDVITTDHHPRDFPNSIHAGFVSRGLLHDSRGRVVGPPVLDREAVSQTELTTLFANDTSLGPDVLSHAWTVDVRRRGREVGAVVSCRANDVDGPLERWATLQVDDHRLLYARCRRGRWSVHHLCVAGAGLLPHEQDYTGLAAVDPHDLDHVYVSTPVDPSTGETHPHHEIYEGWTRDRGESWTWTPVTSGSSVDNLRPVVVPGDPSVHAVVWFRGTMTWSQHYDCETVAIVRPRPTRRRRSRPWP